MPRRWPRWAVIPVSDLDEMERLARRLRDRGFPKLAPVVRSDLVLRSADALEALIERVKRAEAVNDAMGDWPACNWCGGPLQFVNGGEWAGFRCGDTRCAGYMRHPDDYKKGATQ